MTLPFRCFPPVLLLVGVSVRGFQDTQDDPNDTENDPRQRRHPEFEERSLRYEGYQREDEHNAGGGPPNPFHFLGFHREILRPPREQHQIVVNRPGDDLLARRTLPGAAWQGLLGSPYGDWLAVRAAAFRALTRAVFPLRRSAALLHRIGCMAIKPPNAIFLLVFFMMPPRRNDVTTRRLVRPVRENGLPVGFSVLFLVRAQLARPVGDFRKPHGLRKASRSACAQRECTFVFWIATVMVLALRY